MRRLAVLALFVLTPPNLAVAKEEAASTVKPRPMKVIQAPPPKAIAPALAAAETNMPALMRAPPPQADSNQCSMSCAQTYYFCLSGDDPGDCGNGWSQCRSTCSPSAVPSWRWQTR
jgi:hypothetical protein